jgi:hypothetical protein
MDASNCKVCATATGMNKHPKTTATAILNLNGSTFNMGASPGAAVDADPLCSLFLW